MFHAVQHTFRGLKGCVNDGWQILVGIRESNKTPVTPHTSNMPLSSLEFPRAYSPLILMRTSSSGGGSRGSWKRYIDPQSQGLHRKLNPPSVMASNELLWEAGAWNGEFLQWLTFPFACRKFYLREKRGNTMGEWVISPQKPALFLSNQSET